MSAYISFCRHYKLKYGWDERTSYLYPFSCRSLTLRYFDTKPYKSFMKELYRIDDLDLWMESEMELGSSLVKKRVSSNSKYEFDKFNEILNYRLNRIKRKMGFK